MNGTDRYLLIPGAAHGGWSWGPVAERLSAAGAEAAPVTLPGMGFGESPDDATLDDAVTLVVGELDRRRWRGARIVAHSLGGIIAASVAARATDRVEELIFVSAYVPAPGESFVTARPDSDVSRGLNASPDAARPVVLTFDAFATTLMPDQPEAVQRFVHSLLVPTPGRYAADPCTGGDVFALGVPTRYIYGVDDRALVRPGPELAARAGAAPETVPGGHEAFLTHPDEVAAAILDGAGS